ncbi:hypothetical protein [Pseudomonas sp. 22 E 5]|jgi:hypothetical protein|uniref:Type III secretion protein n=2 Tax=Pseudomonas TaxID=286 RepID=A0A4Y9TGW4_PSEFL|nr:MULTISPECIES: hypothetical protein [Pseudomonas]CRM89901.1 hypothetical protein [Pseudomonas sp. 22 E 5]MCX9151976.1 hypothetical protein [Pseudomonas sp. TB1-B1]QXH68189.1 hypothetical protein KSS96_04430 [Pseudomonas asgharzadehiana]TFW43341.1 hypothetical protein E4T65_09870 [Pseudomonas fluorescens]TKJ64734.1 hypothetical protein PspCFBP13506_09410 [Pseudomonas sp. CFBP13506]
MDITHAGFRKNATIAAQVDTPDANSAVSDINFFNAQLNTTEQSGNGIAPALASAASPWDSTESQTLSRRVSKGFRDASQNKKTKDANEFPQSLAEAHIDVMSRVKVIGAIAKGVDKISNLG